jgi:hypothetical protein
MVKGQWLTTDSDPGVVWLHHIHDNGILTYRMGRRGRSLIAEWPGVAQLTCEDDGTRAQLTPCEGAPRPTVDRLQGIVKALLGDLRGGIGLHASAVAIGSRAVLMLGESGAGKSTAAAGLCFHHGGRLLADDAALLEEDARGFRVVPSESHHYLTLQAGEALGVPRPPALQEDASKTAVTAERTATEGYPLALVVWLQFIDALEEPLCESLTGVDAAIRVLGSMFRFDIVDRRQELDRVMRLYEQATFIEVSRPHSEPDALSHILRALGGHGG